jgi:hypothetical protein
MNRRSPPPTEGEQPHFLLGSVVRNGFSAQRSSNPVPIVPSALRTALQRRHGWRRPVLVATGLAAMAAGAVVLIKIPFGPPALKYVVEKAPSPTGVLEKRLRSSDGSTVTAGAATRLRVMSAGRRGAHLRVEEGALHAHIAARPRAEWSVEAGPYKMALAGSGTDLDLTWSAGQTSLSVVLQSGSATVQGPFAHREGLRIKAGETLVARASDGFWRVGRSRPEPGEGELQARSEALALAAPAAFPSRLGPGPSDSPAAVVADGRCRGREASRSLGTQLMGVGEEPGGDPWAWVDRSGCLGYHRDPQGNRLPDFSHAGYRSGGVPLPFVPRAPSTRPIAPGNSGDDTAAIQAAIDAVSARPADASGFRGVVELGSGTFTLRGSLRLMQSGVVLRGQGGDGGGATILRAVGGARTVLLVGPDDVRTVSGQGHRVVDAYVPVGARSFELDSTEGLRVDDEIVVQRPFSQRWLSQIGMDRPGRPEARPVSWRVGAGLTFERRITAIDGKRITIDVPLVNALEREYGDSTVSKFSFPQRIARVGVERLASRADFDPRSDLGDGMFVEVNAVMNGWIREVKTENYESGLVSLEEPSKWITVEDVVYTAPQPSPPWSRAFVLGGQQNLLLRARSVGARHALGTFGRTAGPNVVLDLTGVGRSPMLTPARWTAGLLLDNVRLVDPAGEPAGEVIMRVREGSKGSGWSAANSVVWNSEAGRFSVDNPPTAQNWVFGAAGETVGNGSYDASNAPRPESLYRAQLAERLGDSSLAALSR